MKYCEKCGAQFDDELMQCPYCAPTAAENPAPQEYANETYG